MLLAYSESEGPTQVLYLFSVRYYLAIKTFAGGPMHKQSCLLTVISAVFMLFTAHTAFADSKNSSGYRFNASLSGAQEVPSSSSEASGRIFVNFDRALTKVDVWLRLRGINSLVVASHFHCNRAGANGPVAVGLLNPGPLSEIGERTRVTLTNDDFTGADCMSTVGRPVNNIAALYFAMRDGLIYINVHTPDFPPGEVRGQMIEGY